MFKMTNRFIVISLLRFVSLTDADFAPIPPQSPCDKPNKNILVEHFFNTIFSEFYSSPPVCVCVQMCPGQSTYCYPNGCFKPATSFNTGPAIRNVAEAKIPPTVISAPIPVVQRDKNNFMLVKDERDFMADFLEQNYVDELKDSASTHNPVEDLLPDVFKSKYNIVSRYRKMSTVDLRHNLQDKVKKELVKSEGEWTKTRWPLSRQNKRSGPTVFSHIEKPMRKQGTYFASMIRDNDVPDYSGKYFKRELTKIADDEDKKLKSSYNLDSLVNMTESKIFSLDKLIENLIKSGATGNVETTTNIEISKREETDRITEPAIKEILYTSTTPLSNETTRVISINQTDENIDKNKYVEISLANDAANLTSMIKRLSNQIEIQNNTSMEIAKRTIKSFDTQWYDVQSNSDYKENQMVERSLEDIEMKTVPATSNSEENSTTESVVTVKSTVETVPEKTTTSSLKLTSPQEKRVTRKNRQKVVKKSGSSKIN